MNTLDPRLQKLVDLGESGTDIMHGELKNLMHMAEQDMVDVDMDDPIYPYLEGLLDGLSMAYRLTYDLSFAIADRIKANG